VKRITGTKGQRHDLPGLDVCTCTIQRESIQQFCDGSGLFSEEKK